MWMFTAISTLPVRVPAWREQADSTKDNHEGEYKAAWRDVRFGRSGRLDIGSEFKVVFLVVVVVVVVVAEPQGTYRLERSFVW